MPKYAPQSQSAMLDAQHQQHAAQLAQISDYDSDIHGNASDYPAAPPRVMRDEEQMNLAVLQRYNNDIVSVMSKAPYAVIYEFSSGLWTKTGIEGTLFICQLRPGSLGEDRYIAFVLNRRGLDNWEAPLLNGDRPAVEFLDQYVIVEIIKNHEEKTYGIYIHSESFNSTITQARKDLAELMRRLAEMAKISLQKAEHDAAGAHARHTNGHLRNTQDFSDDQSGTSLGRQITVEQLFGQQPSQNLRSQILDGASDTAPPSTYQPNQPDVLTDLFRRAGFPMR
jgi:hypothetical protein